MTPLSPRAPSGERGSVAVFSVVVLLGLLAMVGLVVDGGGKVRALQQAEAVAAEAARAGGQAVRVGSVYQAGGPAQVDPQRARAAALNHVSAAGMSGTATVTADATRIRVSATATYEPVFLGLLGIGTQTVTGDGEADLTRVLDGTPQ